MYRTRLYSCGSQSLEHKKKLDIAFVELSHNSILITNKEQLRLKIVQKLSRLQPQNLLVLVEKV